MKNVCVVLRVADFYSEETVNNQGLECLRFLNEVISDFDAVSSDIAYFSIHEELSYSQNFLEILRDFQFFNKNYLPISIRHILLFPILSFLALK